MIFYNITFLVDKELGTEGADYLRNNFIPEAICSGLLSNPCMKKVLYTPNDDSESYAVQFHAGSIELLNAWNDDHGRRLQHRLRERFGERILCFATILEEISLHDDR
ncbi:MAG: DUF4286 family protein [Tannerellaceae bacterium]|jgi:hypothetical protein|nr:DUF4286 family protein [Tannerellaceae bacterium]